MRTKREKVGHFIVWALFFVLFGGLVYSSASFQCMCGHRAMDPVLGGGVFLGMTVLGLVVGREVDKQTEFQTMRGIAVAIAMMFVGVVAASIVAGNDLDDAHRNMFKPADPAAVGDVTF